MFRSFWSWRGFRRFKKGRGNKPVRKFHWLPFGRYRIPLFEMLELRALLSGNTYTPSLSVADSAVAADNNLRSAISAANADLGTATDTIMLGSGTYTLLLGELEITNSAHNLIIQGQGSTGANATIIDQLSLDRVFEVDEANPNVTVTFEDLEITGGTAETDPISGVAEGGGILSQGNLTLTDVAVVGNKAAASAGGLAFGGGVSSENGTLTIQSLTPGASLIEDNSALGGIGSNPSDGGGAFGGGIFSGTNDQVGITGTTIADNAALGGNCPSGSTASGGTADGGGAYISNGGGSPVVFDSDSITGNQAIGGAGGTGSGGYAIGGGVEIATADLGTAGSGAAASITNTTIAYNTARGGAEGSNVASDGGFAVAGGIYLGTTGSPPSQVVNDTIYGNNAIGGSGPVAGNGSGGGIEDATDSNGQQGGLAIINTTVAFNSAQAGIASQGQSSFAQGGGIDSDTDPALAVANSVIAGNLGGGSPDVNDAGAQTDSNVIGDGTGSTGFSDPMEGNDVGTGLLPVDPMLGPLQNNGGPTATAALLPGSPAINLADVNVFNQVNLPNDQRGLPRVVNNSVDSGAYQTQAVTATNTTTTALGTSGAAGQSVTLTATVSPPVGVLTVPTGIVTFYETLGVTTIAIGSAPLVDGVANFQTATLPVGTATLTASYSGDPNFLGSNSGTVGEDVVSISGNSYAPLTVVNDSTTTTDNNLRAAVAAANADSGTADDTILLQSGTYALSFGALNITNPSHTLTIQGNGSSGPNATIIDQLSLDRVLDIAPNVTVVLENLEITGGLGETDANGGTSMAEGGGILSQGNLTLTNVAVVGNKAVGIVPGEESSGGGIYSLNSVGNPLTVNTGSVIGYNSALNTVEAVGANPANAGLAFGGGVYLSELGSVQISATTITTNFAQGAAGAAATANSTGGFGSSGVGGGIYFGDADASDNVLNDDTIAGNFAYGGDGGTAQSAIGGNGGSGAGGGVAVTDGSLTISNTTLSGNIAHGGTGGVGGVAQGFGGSAAGGGILGVSQSTPVSWQLLNSTLFGNSAVGGVGQTGGNAAGGGIEDQTSGMTIVNVTIASNTAQGAPAITAGQSFGGGIDNSSAMDTSLQVQNTLIAGNTATTGPDFDGTAASTDHNLLGNATGAFGFSAANGDQLGTITTVSPINPKLGPLQNNGGTTLTLALLAGSPALGAGNPADAMAQELTLDQRGQPRFVSGTVDIGAVESQIVAPTVTAASTTENTQTTSGLVITSQSETATSFQITSITGGTLYQHDGTTQIHNGDFITLAQGTAGLKFTPTPNSLATGSFTIQESTDGSVAGLSGPLVVVTIPVTLAGPKVTNAATTENTQTTSGLMITPGNNDSSATNFEITGISGGTLFQHDGITQIHNGNFITLAQGAAGLKFTPAGNSLASGSFTVQESTSGVAGGLNGPTAVATITVTLSKPKVANAATTENTQTTSGLVITAGTGDNSVSNFQITGITGGTLYQNDGTTQIHNGDFISVVQGTAGLKFTPTANSLASGSFTAQESTSGTAGGLGGSTTTATITVTLFGPKVTSSATQEDTQSTSGLVIMPGTNDISATNFQITSISGGTLYQHDGTTQITSGSFITLAQGAAGLKFTPTLNSLATGSFAIQESTSGVVGGLSGATATATITVTASSPTVTNATTTENTQTTSGLVITPKLGTTTFFQIGAITGGALYQNDGTTQIHNGDFITLAQGAAGLTFTPTSNSLAGGSFTAQESSSNSVAGLGGTTASATITVTFSGPAVPNAATTENTQTTSGLMITTGTNDSSATNLQITGITGGTLFQNNGTTPIHNGDFITVAQGAAGLKFTPSSNSLAAGSFTVQESASGALGGLSGPTATATITVTLSGPNVTGATTQENTQSASGLVITRATGDTSVTNFQISGITGGTLFQNDGTTQILNGQFISLTQGAAGLKFSPTADSLGAGSFTVQESTSGVVGGLGGSTATATITVTLSTPNATNAATTENTQTTSGLVITPKSGATTYLQIGAITGGTLFQNDGTTPINSGDFITVAQGAAGLRFTPTSNSLATGSFTAQESSSNSMAGLSGTTGVVTITVMFLGPKVTNAATTEKTQTTSGLMITTGASDSTATNLQITGITGGTLFQNDGTTQIHNGDFITVAQGAAGLKFTPSSNSLASGSFTVQESASGLVGGLSGPTATATITVSLHGPLVTNATTTENTQNTTGLVVTPNALDMASVTNFQITGITGGTLFQHDGTTPINSGDFITAAQGAAGLKFLPTTGSLAGGSFTAQESTSGAIGGLGGSTATATITVTLSQPKVTNAATTENLQTTSGLVITPGTHDTTATNFQITGIIGGTLFQHDGTTQIANGSFITLAQGAAGLKLTPAPNSLATGSFTVQESTSGAVGGLSGPTATATISVTLFGPKVTNAATTENTQSTSGLVLTPGTHDTTAAYFQITGITGGTLFQHDGTTAIASGDFITAAEGAAGLKFTPAPNSLATGSFTVQESTTGVISGLSGPTAAAAITVTLSGPKVTNAATTENTQTTSGLVLTPGTHDSTVAYFRITNITGGTLYQNNGTTGIASGDFITAAEGEAGLKFTPTGSLATGSFGVQESTTSGLNGPTVAATITVTLSGPKVTSATTTENTQLTSGLVITPGTHDSSATYFQITGITGGTLFQHDGTTAIASGDFITVAQGAAGLKFTPASNSLAAGSFTVRESTSGVVAGLSGSTATATIGVTLFGAKVTTAATTENTQSTSGLVITPGTHDSSATYFQITGITGGTLFQQDGATQITSGSFITLAQGAAGLRFTPTTGSLATGSFAVQESTTGALGGLNGPTATATIAVTLGGAKVTNAATTENTQTTSGLVLTPGTHDSTVAYFRITNITGGTLYQNNGTTGIASGDFITAAEGEAGLKFTPSSGSLATGSFSVQESTTGGLSGPTVAATIAVAFSGPKVTGATTPQNAQTTSGLVLTPGTHDSTVAYFRITGITGGTLYQKNGTTPIGIGSFITAAQGAAGLRFTPTTGPHTTASFSVRESTTNTASGLSGPTVVATINVTPQPNQAVNLSIFYNSMGITADGAKFSGGLDGQGNALAARELGTSQTWNGSTFTYGPVGKDDLIQAVGQALPLPSAAFSKVELLATSVNGYQFGQPFTVNYTDGTTQTFIQNMSDWNTPKNYSGESTVSSMLYRTTSVGGFNNAGPFYVYGYSFPLNGTKSVESISLPDDPDVKILAISMVTIIAAPTNLTATAVSGTTVNLSWTAATGTVTGYNVYRGTTAGGESTTPINSSPLSATATSYSDSTGVPGNTYFYVIRAINSPAIGPASVEAKATLPASGPATQVDLRGQYNLAGITADGAVFQGGLDGNGDALSANQLGPIQTWNGTTFSIAPAGSRNVVQATGQTIGLPNGHYSNLEMLATAVNGNQVQQKFTVNYTDGTSLTVMQSFSNWILPQNYPGESVALSMTYRNTSSGGQVQQPVDVYGYSIPVDPTKTIRSITLPNDTHVQILAITAVA